ncbi:thioesterase II family protein [Actinoplanes teichomyceticus]|uniref:Surfactin synthase thioesterase subunit n=1 Tax=Actinoplanes teichomyceticus TaxID=1867 RepID=A0A561WK04_ACTTI|nr:alpha/beta fold hydrolase [Actinoplanes teichomyceticus]TWG24197.1 surfactin synthase thioesterase subunit [Actinoplanes teichomyceticus]GIF12956.1 thioesterase [Actinoplanes teichomyceticus]
MSVTFFFPGAGSFGGETPAGAVLIRYPGRYGRGFGVPAPSFDAVVDACLAQLARRAGTPPTLVGHSYGAYVAYATAARLGQVAGLVVIGANAPARHEVAADALRDPAGYLQRVDPQALADVPSPEWRDIVAETTAQDLRLLTEFDPAAVAPLSCPVLAVRGESDPLTSDEGIGAWRSCTGGAFTARTLPGGHSTVLRDPSLAPDTLDVEETAR